MEIELNGYYTMILATLVLLLGRWLVVKIRFLSDFNIPEPVAGGRWPAACWPASWCLRSTRCSG